MSSRVLKSVVVWGWVGQFVLLAAGSPWWHDHGPTGLPHLRHGACRSDAPADSGGATCRHGHRHRTPRAEADSGRAADRPRGPQGPRIERDVADHDCAVCRFLAQPQPLVAAGAAAEQIAPVALRAPVEPQEPERTALAVPPARGPPGEIAG